MAQRFEMTLRVPLPEDVFEHAAVMMGIKKVMDALAASLREHAPSHEIETNVLTPRPKQLAGESADGKKRSKTMQLVLD